MVLRCVCHYIWTTMYTKKKKEEFKDTIHYLLPSRLFYHIPHSQSSWSTSKLHQAFCPSHVLQQFNYCYRKNWKFSTLVKCVPFIVCLLRWPWPSTIKLVMVTVKDGKFKYSESLLDSGYVGAYFLFDTSI